MRPHARRLDGFRLLGRARVAVQQPPPPRGIGLGQPCLDHVDHDFVGHQLAGVHALFRACARGRAGRHLGAQQVARRNVDQAKLKNGVGWFAGWTRGRGRLGPPSAPANPILPPPPLLPRSRASSTILAHCVPLPAAGGPAIMTRRGAPPGPATEGAVAAAWGSGGGGWGGRGVGASATARGLVPASADPVAPPPIPSTPDPFLFHTQALLAAGAVARGAGAGDRVGVARECGLARAAGRAPGCGLFWDGGKVRA